MFASLKHLHLKGPLLSKEENEVCKQTVVLHSQHFIFFATYKKVQ